MNDSMIPPGVPETSKPPMMKVIAQHVILLGWMLFRILTLRPRAALENLRYASWQLPVILGLGTLACALRWSDDLSQGLKNSSSFLVYLGLLVLIGPRCRKFVLGYALMSAFFDVVLYCLYGPVPTGSNLVDPDHNGLLRFCLSFAELIVTISLIVGAARLPRVKQGASG